MIQASIFTLLAPGIALELDLRELASTLAPLVLDASEKLTVPLLGQFRASWGPARF